MLNSEDDYSGLTYIQQWEKMRLEAKGFRYASDLDSFAARHYARWPKHPLDAFDEILWKTINQRRLDNRNSAKHKRANLSVEPTGIMTRLFDTLAIPTFFTIPITKLGFSVGDADAKNYQDTELITDIKEALKQDVAGSAWQVTEVNRKNLIHSHVLAEHDALPFDAFSELIYEPRGMFKYLIKGIPYNVLNLATFFKAKKLLVGNQHLVRKSGTIRLPYSKN